MRAAYILHTMLLVLVSSFVVAIVALWPVISIDFVAVLPLLLPLFLLLLFVETHLSVLHSAPQRNLCLLHKNYSEHCSLADFDGE